MTLKIVTPTLQLLPLFLLTLATIVPTAQAQSSTNPAPANRPALNVSALNRNQQAIYLEKGKFTNKIQDLGVDLSNTKTDYLYALLTTRTNTLQYAIARRRDLKSYVGRVTVVRQSNGNATTKSIVCENDRPGNLRPAPPRLDTNLKLICAPGTTKFTPLLSFGPEAWNSTGKTLAGSMMRAQQAYYLENIKFSTTVDELGLGTEDELDDYYPSHQLSIQANDRFAYQYLVSRRDDVKSYVSVVVLGYTFSIPSEQTTFGLVCENEVPGRLRPAAPIIMGPSGSPVCAAGTRVVR